MKPVHPPELLEHRRQEAIAVAEQCAQILRQEFGAIEIILFGSLRGDAPWHWQSDLDLAVSGISDKALWQAHQKLALVMPDWLKFDLVDLEKVTPQVRSRILQQPMSTDPYLALKIHIDDEMAALERLSIVLTALLAQADTIPDIALIPALASYVTDFYTGCERISERVAVALDGGIPEGSNWHEQLLRQVADSGKEGRPPLWQGSLLLDLNEYRKFRHFDRHRYKLELKLDRVLELARQVQPTHQKIRQAIADFDHWLIHQSTP